MKIKFSNWRGTKEDVSLSQAINEACTPNAYSYEGQLEKIKAENDKLKEMLVKLIETIYDEEQKFRPVNEKLQHILGYEFEVE